MTKSMTESQRQVLTRWLYLIGFLDLFGVSIIIPFMSPRIRELGGTAATAGIIGSVYGAIQLFSSPIVGNFSDLLGRRRVLIICLFLTSIGYTCIGFSNTLLLLSLARIPIGIFKHSLSLAKAYVSDVYSRKEQPGIFGKFNAISNAGFIVGPLCGGHLATTDNGFLKVSLLSGSIFFINGFLVYIFFNVDENHPQKKNSSDEIEQTESIDDENQGNLFAIFHNLRQLPWGEVYEILIIRFLMALSVIFFRTSLSLFLVDRYHADPKIIGYILSYSGLLGGLSGFIVGKLSDFYKGNSLRAVLHCDLIAGLSILGCTFSKDLWIFCICLLPLSISTNMARVHFTSILVNSGKDNEHGALIGIGQSIMSLGRMLSPSIVGILQVINIFLPGIVAVIINIVTAIAIVFMMPTRIHSKQE